VEGRILGLDVGDVRTGVALSDPFGIFAQAYAVVDATAPDQGLAEIRRIAEETQAERIVIGLPLDQDGQPGPQAQKVMEFVEALRPVVNAQIETIDERFSTVSAERILIDANVRRKKRKQVVDKVAAQQILQTYLDRRATQKRLNGDGTTTE